MNGQLPCPFQKLSLPNALLASCLLHLGFIMLPYWGYRLEISNGLDHDTPTVSARLLNITLTPRRANAETALQPQIEVNPADPVNPPATQESSLQPSTQKTEATQAQTQTSEATSSYVETPILPLDAPKFYPAEQLTHSPVPIEFKDLDTPETSDIIAAGQMTIKLWIDEQGIVVHVSVEKTDLPPKLVESTVTSFQQMRFTPGERYGRAVGSLMMIEVNYDDGRPPQAPASISTEGTNSPPQITPLPQP